MTLCINQSGTWRNITTLCVNQSGTWRNTNIGCINDSGTWRKFLSALVTRVSLGTSVEGGTLICRASNVAWIVAPNTSEVSRTWYCRNDANTTAQSVSGCTGWFVPTCGQLQNPGYTCRTYWDSCSCQYYWSSSAGGSSCTWLVCVTHGAANFLTKDRVVCVRAFRCVTY